MREAIRVTGLSPVLASLPMGLKTVIADGGTAISSGQRQRILLARNVYDQPKMMVLDEATSSLDAAAELEFINALRDTGTTIVICTHRHERLTDADQIIAMDQGRLVMRSTVRFNKIAAVGRG